MCVVNFCSFRSVHPFFSFILSTSATLSSHHLPPPKAIQPVRSLARCLFRESSAFVQQRIDREQKNSSEGNKITASSAPPTPRFLFSSSFGLKIRDILHFPERNPLTTTTITSARFFVGASPKEGKKNNNNWGDFRVFDGPLRRAKEFGPSLFLSPEHAQQQHLHR